jgi:hypothetical protein
MRLTSRPTMLTAASPFCFLHAPVVIHFHIDAAAAHGAKPPVPKLTAQRQAPGRGQWQASAGGERVVPLTAGLACSFEQIVW